MLGRASPSSSHTRPNRSISLAEASSQYRWRVPVALDECPQEPSPLIGTLGQAPVPKWMVRGCRARPTRRIADPVLAPASVRMVPATAPSRTTTAFAARMRDKRGVRPSRERIVSGIVPSRVDAGSMTECQHRSSAVAGECIGESHRRLRGSWPAIHHCPTLPATLRMLKASSLPRLERIRATFSTRPSSVARLTARR